MVSSIVDRGFESRCGHTKEYKIGICYFSTKQTAAMGKAKDWLVQNQG